MKWLFEKYLVLESEQRQKRVALQTVVWIGIFISAIKFVAYAYTHSNAILTDSLESLINLVAGLFALFSLYYTAQPRDNKHPYGHGKMEFLAAALEGILVFGAGTAIIIKAVYNMYHPQEVHSLGVGIGLIAATAITNFILAVFLLRKAKTFKSLILKADGKRIMTDSLSSIGLTAGLVIMYFTDWVQIDNLLAVAAGIFILHTGYKLIKESLKGLLDEADSSTIEEVVQLLLNNDNKSWIDVKNIRTSHYGMYLYIDCQMTMPRYWDLQKINEQVKDAELLINKHFKERVELFVQAEPCLPKHCAGCRVENCHLREAVYRQRGPSVLKLHHPDESIAFPNLKENPNFI